MSVALPGDVVHVDARVAVDRKTATSDIYATLTPGDYHSLIREGAAEIVSNVEAIIDGPLPVICDITGGQDSRVLLAALVATGRVRDVVFYTKSFSEREVRLRATGDAHEAIRRKRADVEIAAALVRRYNGSYYPKSAPSEFTKSPIDENLRFWRSHRFGSYHFMTSDLLRTMQPVFDTPMLTDDWWEWRAISGLLPAVL